MSVYSFPCINNTLDLSNLCIKPIDSTSVRPTIHFDKRQKLNFIGVK